MINGNCERGWMQGKVDSEEVESKWLKGVTSNKSARVHENFKSEDLILK